MFFAPTIFENNRAFETAAEVGRLSFKLLFSISVPTFSVRTRCLLVVACILEVRTTDGLKGEKISTAGHLMKRGKRLLILDPFLQSVYYAGQNC